MSSIFSFINRLLPFATPGTPLVQDLGHLLALCSLLYFAPQIQVWIQGTSTPAFVDDSGNTHDEPNENPIDADVVEPLQQDDTGPAPEPEHVNVENGEPLEAQEADPVRPGPVTEIRDQRQIGAKKAKSLARRDQKRAYHEFQRSQGEAQRARDAEGAAERDAALAAERERRKATEAALEAKKAKEREKRRDQERREREDEIRRRELTVRLVRRELEERKRCDLFKVARQVGDDVDEEWVEKILHASGMIGRKGETMTMITGMGWVVRVNREDMVALYKTAQLKRGKGTFAYDELGVMLESIL